MQDGCQIIVIDVDFTKAFDIVEHDKLFVILRAFGIDGTACVSMYYEFIQQFSHYSKWSLVGRL